VVLALVPEQGLVPEQDQTQPVQVVLVLE